jgi:hypothetical protein
MAMRAIMATIVKFLFRAPFNLTSSFDFPIYNRKINVATSQCQYTTATTMPT